MSKTLSLFLASPGDVPGERMAVREIVDDFNKTTGQELHIEITVVGYDSHSVPEYGADPQTIINKQIGEMEFHDLFVAIMWNRFGTPTERAGSGTEEECLRAIESFKAFGKPRIMMYFGQMPFNPKTLEDIQQKAKVLAFKEEGSRKSLNYEYADIGDFRNAFRKHIETVCISFTSNSDYDGDGPSAGSELLRIQFDKAVPPKAQGWVFDAFDGNNAELDVINDFDGTPVLYARSDSLYEACLQRSFEWSIRSGNVVEFLTKTSGLEDAYGFRLYVFTKVHIAGKDRRIWFTFDPGSNILTPIDFGDEWEEFRVPCKIEALKDGWMSVRFEIPELLQLCYPNESHPMHFKIGGVRIRGTVLLASVTVFA